MSGRIKTPAVASKQHSPAAGRLNLTSRKAWRVLVQTIGACLRYRVTGLAAEAAFFAILSLPPLIFGLAGAIGFIANSLDVQTIASFRERVLALASRALTQDSVTKVIAPTLDDVLSGGRFEIISIGFVIALWSGSRALNVFVDTITIMYGLAGKRGIVRTRALSFSLYLVFLLVGVVLLPLVLAGPSFVDNVLPDQLDVVGLLYWPVVLLGSVCFLATLYHLSVPVRVRWRADLPGAALALGMWIGGSALLRIILDASSDTTSIYGPLAAPIAVLLWLYLVSLAVLIGAAFNAAVDKVWPRRSGIDHPKPRRSKESSAQHEILALGGRESCRATRNRCSADRTKWGVSHCGRSSQYVRIRFDNRERLAEGCVHVHRDGTPLRLATAGAFGPSSPVWPDCATLHRPWSYAVNEVSSVLLLTPKAPPRRL